jgi:hypothetical protein
MSVKHTKGKQKDTPSYSFRRNQATNLFAYCDIYFVNPRTKGPQTAFSFMAHGLILTCKAPFLVTETTNSLGIQQTN